MRRVTAYLQMNLAEAVRGEQTVAVSVGPDHDPFVLCLRNPTDYRLQQGGGSLPRLRADRPNDFRVHRQTDWGLASIRLAETTENFHFVQPLGDDRLILVRSRAEDESDRNAHVYNTEGEEEWSFHAGDGIEEVQTTRDAQVWVSYFDEGVYGDQEPGRSGLVAFDERGRIVFRFDEMPGPSSSISDCYALNVASDRDVWAYYYTDFPLVHVRDRRFGREWQRVPVRGSHAFAVTEGRALFAGSYEVRELLFLVDLDTMEADALRPVDQDGNEVRFDQAFGRGSRLYLVSGDALLVVELREL